jgi:hypothetical protein
MDVMKNVLIWIGILFGLVAALLWFYSTIAKVDYTPQTDRQGWTDAAITRIEGDRTIDVLSTADRQTKINKWAAIATALSVISQLAALIFSR